MCVTIRSGESAQKARKPYERLRQIPLWMIKIYAQFMHRLKIYAQGRAFYPQFMHRFMHRPVDFKQLILLIF
ncbi:MAG: hypothetical protein EA369_05285 [Bradymonadales bacterium]|nr:MAG: hypothetical protein EA369_05285 [Bradymonadales bacterium]